jgi:glutaredoxin 3
MNVRIYTTPTCGYCHQAKRFLSERGVRFTEHDVSIDQSAANEMVRLSGQMGVPVIVVDGEVVVGFNRTRLEQLFVDKTRSQHVYFGLSVANASKIIHRSDTTTVLGAFVGKVAQSSLGDRAGLKPGDVITELNLRTIRNADDLEDALSSLNEGNRVLIRFRRGQEKLESEVII